MKVFITRHGKTDYNERQLVCGVLESQLTEEGRAQAEELARILERDQERNRICHIFSSPLKRAVETAGYAARALGLEIQTDERLMEVHFGSCEGVGWDDEEFVRVKRNPFLRYRGGESTIDAAHRAYSFMDDLRSWKLDGNVLIVCHGTFARILSTYFVDYTLDEYWSTRWKNCELRSYEL